MRVWLEEDADGRRELCGKVQRPVSGEAQRFRSWASMVELLMVMFGEKKEAQG